MFLVKSSYPVKFSCILFPKSSVPTSARIVAITFKSSGFICSFTADIAFSMFSTLVFSSISKAATIAKSSLERLSIFSFTFSSVVFSFNLSAAAYIELYSVPNSSTKE